MSFQKDYEALETLITEKYENLSDFYMDNPSCTLDSLEYADKLILEARELFKTGSKATQEEKDAWFEKVKDIEKM
jgi:hypothetical protein